VARDSCGLTVQIGQGHLYKAKVERQSGFIAKRWDVPVNLSMDRTRRFRGPQLPVWRVLRRISEPPHVGCYELSNRVAHFAVSLEVVHDNFLADAFKDTFDELDVQGMDLVVVLGFFVGKNEVEGDLIRLIHYRAMAGNHFSDVKVERAGDGL
jgi:hypothetical protein